MIPINKELGEDIFEDLRPQTKWENHEDEIHDFYNPYEDYGDNN